MSKKDERFEVVESYGGLLHDMGLVQILRDKQTGVQYVWARAGYAGGLTPLLDADGKPLVCKGE